MDLTEGSHPTPDRVVTAQGLRLLLAADPAGAGTLSSSARSQLRGLLAATPTANWEKVVTTWVRRTQPSAVDLGELGKLPAELSRLRWWPVSPSEAPARADARSKQGTNS